MEQKTYVVYYTPTITDPDPDPDVITGVLINDPQAPKDMVKFDVGAAHPLVLIGVENVMPR